MMSMTMSVLQHLDPVFTPWGDNSPPSSDHMGWPESKIMSSSGDLSSASPSPEEGLAKSSWSDEDLSRRLGEKLLELEPKDCEDRYVPDRLDLGQSAAADHSNYKFRSNLGDDYVNQTYRSVNPRYKTEVCRNFMEKGTCLYGELCQFAHGNNELRKDVARHSKYKTKLCQKYWIAGYCAYGPRCNFIHQEIEKDQALRVLAGISNNIRNRGGYFEAANKSYTDMRRNLHGRTFLGPDELDRNFAQLRLSGGINQFSNFSSSPSPVDLDRNVAELLPRNFGMKEENFGYYDFSRISLGS